MARRWIPRIAAGVFVLGIAGLIVSSVAGNNAGWVLSVGLAIVVAATALLTHSAITHRDRIDAFDAADSERAAQDLEEQVAALVAQGVAEDAVRRLVRDAMRIGRR